MGLEGLLAGRLLLGRYRVGMLLGRGGMGIVYRGRDERLDREVALKVLSLPALPPRDQDRARSRFNREARAAARLSHPNVVRVYDFGTDEALDLEVLVMELLEGRDLGEWLEESGPPPLPVALQLLRQAAEGLAAGHRAGLVHRDVKPGNLFVSTGAGPLTLQVLDFGIAQLAGGELTQTQLTVAGLTPHTAAYASPEQLGGVATLTPASDVYSLAATAVYLLTAERPFLGAGLPERREATTPLTARLEAAGVPGAVTRVLFRALAVDPRRRFADTAEFAAALDEASAAPISIPTRAPAVPASQPAQARAAPRVSRPPQGTRPSSTGAIGSILAAAAFATGVVVLGFLVLIYEPENEPDVYGWPPPVETTNPRPPLSEEEWQRIITRIRADYQRTEALAPRLPREVFVVDRDSPARGRWEVHHDAGQIVRAVRTREAGGERIRDAFYFRGAALYFVYRRTQPASGQAAPAAVWEDRFYFEGGSLVRWQDATGQFASTTDLLAALQRRELTEAASELLRLQDLQ